MPSRRGRPQGNGQRSAPAWAFEPVSMSAPPAHAAPPPPPPPPGKRRVTETRHRDASAVLRWRRAPTRTPDASTQQDRAFCGSSLGSGDADAPNPRNPWPRSSGFQCARDFQPPPPPLLSDWAKVFLRVFGQSKIFSGAFAASQFRPKNFFGAFGASNNSGSPAGGGPPTAPPPPPHLGPPPLQENSGGSPDA